MPKLSRRAFSQVLGGSVAATAFAMPFIARAANPKVVVIGGGAGGGTAARYIAKDSKGAIDVTLTCFSDFKISRSGLTLWCASRIG